MIGTFGSSAFQRAEDFQNPQDYLNYLCGSTKGFFTRNVKNAKGYFSETFHTSDALADKQYIGVSDCYFSQNSVCSPRSAKNPESGRKVNNIKRLNALYVDIDCYKIGMTQWQVLYNLEDNYFNRVIPVPTFVINSGRGIYLIWHIDEDRNALPRWQSVEDYLIAACKEFNADSQASDAARILRVPFTVNSNNGETVSIMRFTDVKYTLHEIIKEFGVPSTYKRSRLPVHPYGQATEKQRITAKWIATALELPLPNFDSYDETSSFISENLPFVATGKTVKKEETCNKYDLDKIKSLRILADGRIRDLFKLFTMRHGEDCCREYALFLCRIWSLDITNDADAAITTTLALNASFDRPFKREYVLKATASAEKKWKSGETYRYSTRKIISVLNITQEEQGSLSSLCDTTNEKQRKQKANRAAYLTRLEKAGVETKQTAIVKRRAMIAELMRSGIDSGTICIELGISLRTLERDKKAIKEEKENNKKENLMSQKASDAALAEASLVAPICAEEDPAEDRENVEQTAPTKIQSLYYKSNSFAIAACAVLLPYIEDSEFFNSS